VFKAIGTGQINKSVLVLGTVFVVAGLAFKLGAVPFHMWVPDVYQGAPSAITLMVGGAPKLAAFAITIRLLSKGCSASQWTGSRCLCCSRSPRCCCSATCGDRAEQHQADAGLFHDRQIGFMLLGLCPRVVSGNTRLGGQCYSSAMFYVVVDVLTSLGTFGMIMLLSRVRPRGRADRRLPRPGEEEPVVRRGDGGADVLARRHPADGRLLRQAGGAAGARLDQRAPASSGSAVVAVLLSLLGAFYYLRVVKVMYFDEPARCPSGRPARPTRGSCSRSTVAAVLLLGILPGGLMQMCAQAIVQMFAT
jgi:NADH-quinone oxidoreductase subunit N